MKQVEQVDINGEIVFDYDSSLSKKDIVNKLSFSFPSLRFENDLLVGTYENVNYSILIKNVTYLGNPHPAYKKRIQIAGLQDFYYKSIQLGYKPLLLGIYSYKENTIFCDFGINTYIYKKSHNSSAHVYTDDLSCATKDGIFQKEDAFNNIVTTFRPDYVNYFLEDKLSSFLPKTNNYELPSYQNEEDFIIFDTDGNYIAESCLSDNEVVYVANKPKDVLDKIFGDFFSIEKKEWNGIECYSEMIASNYNNKFQPEWVGFYLEYEFDKYINNHKLLPIAKYAQDKKKDGIDLDLYFTSINSFGDLKAHSSSSKAIQGNDWNTIFKILTDSRYSNHIYYIVCEHTTEKDKDHNYEVTKYWNRTQKKQDEMSYSSKMKHSVKLLKYYILDINNNNKQFLTKFKQGINSNGKLREPKIMIERDNFNKFVISEVIF